MYSRSASVRHSGEDVKLLLQNTNITLYVIISIETTLTAFLPQFSFRMRSYIMSGHVNVVAGH